MIIPGGKKCRELFETYLEGASEVFIAFVGHHEQPVD
jgi:hypothetical protein